MINDFIPPRPLLPGEPSSEAVYCAECEYLEQDVIGSKNGSCFGHSIQDSHAPIKCHFHKNGLHLISVFVFLKSGISVYHKAIVKDLTKDIDPSLLTSFLQAINSFGEELTNEQMSVIKFQKMNIVFCRGKYSNGAMLIKGKFKEEAKEVFSCFLERLEVSYPSFFINNYAGKCLPEEEVDNIAIELLKDYAREKFYPISSSIIEKSCHLICGKTSK